MRPTPFTPEEVKRWIEIILSEGLITVGSHARGRMRKRDADIEDVRHALSCGEVGKTPEWSDDHQDWKYRVTGIDLESDELVVISVIIQSHLTLFVVTIF